MKEKNYNVILIGIDTLRADKLGIYGYNKRPTSTNIDEFARNSLLFLNCRSQAPHTTPSFMSIMTGRYPSHHGVTLNMLGVGNEIRRAYGLDNNIPTLAQIMKKNGYRTGSFNEGGALAGIYGFSKGFDYYEQNYNYLDRLKKRKFGVIPKNEIFYWLEENKNDKFFLFLHSFVVHSPWFTPPPYYKMYDKDYTGALDSLPEAKDIKKNLYRFFLDLVLKEGERDLEHYRALYDEAIKYVDDFFGDLLNHLKELKILENTVIIFTSDHGEEFMDHGHLGHEQLYTEHLHVPLIIRSPEHKTQRIDQIVRSIDIMPTILDLLDLEYELTDGTSLLPALEKDLEFVAVADSEAHGIAIEKKNYKYILHTNKPRNNRLDEIYNLLDDPKEKNNIVKENVKLAEEMLFSYYNELHRMPFPSPRKKIIYL